MAKNKRTGGSPSATESPTASSRGGGVPGEIEYLSAATNTKLGDGTCETEGVFAGLAAGVSCCESDTGDASRTKQRRAVAPTKPKPVLRDAAGDSLSVTEVQGASQNQNGHADVALKPMPAVRGRKSRAGDGTTETDSPNAGPPTNGRATSHAKPVRKLHDPAAGGESMGDTATSIATCRVLQSLQRRRVAALKSRIAIDNQLAAVVSTELGYFAGMSEEDRKARRKKASELVDAIRTVEKPQNGRKPNAKAIAKRAAAQALIDSHGEAVAAFTPLVIGVESGREQLAKFIESIEAEMVSAAETLPVAEWAKSVKGFGVLRLAVVIGETGDLSQYGNPGKVWKRMG